MSDPPGNLLPSDRFLSLDDIREIIKNNEEPDVFLGIFQALDKDPEDGLPVADSHLYFFVDPPEFPALYSFDKILKFL